MIFTCFQRFFCELWNSHIYNLKFGRKPNNFGEQSEEEKVEFRKTSETHFLQLWDGQDRTRGERVRMYKIIRKLFSLV